MQIFGRAARIFFYMLQMLSMLGNEIREAARRVACDRKGQDREGWRGASAAEKSRTHDAEGEYNIYIDAEDGVVCCFHAPPHLCI